MQAEPWELARCGDHTLSGQRFPTTPSAPHTSGRDMAGCWAYYEAPLEGPKKPSFHTLS